MGLLGCCQVMLMLTSNGNRKDSYSTYSDHRKALIGHDSFMIPLLLYSIMQY